MGTTREYGCILQKKRKGVKTRGHKLRADGRLPPQGPTKYVQHSYPVDSDGMEVEESSEFGPISLNSDSDDSVDREIEEAIQEYLKNKGQRIPSLPDNAKSLSRTNTGKCLRKEGPSCDVACDVFPGSVKTGVIPQPLAPDFLRDDALQWASSPCSVSSDDSFEQSIKAEIEQFLNEKKQQARKKTVSVGRKNLHQKEVLEKVTRQKSGTSKASPNPLKRGGKAFFLRRHPELQNTSSPPKRWVPGTEELVDGQKTSQLHLNAPGAGHSCILEQSNGDEIRQRFWKAGGDQGLESANLSDSSSDDGIEEAIQLYQLEKVRKAANAQASCVPSQKKEFGTGGLADISTSLTIHSEKSALPENLETALNCKRKQSSSKPADLNRTSAICNELGKGRCCSSLANDFASGAVTSQTCRADTAAELMCAEAILDISKTILLPPLACDSRALLTDPFLYSQGIPPSHQESDSNAVDSDDSIEQEIRAFLAIKAQTEHLITKSDEASNTAPNFLSCGQLDDQIESPKQFFPNTLKLPLDHKRHLKEESSISRQRLDEQMALLKTGCSHLDTGSHSKSMAFQKDNVGSNVKNSERQQEVTPAAVSLVGFVTPLSPGLLGTGELLKNARQALQKYSTDDKSSSLDSDEDLDTAIKDLLRSKRKLKKKSKDQKIQCKKKVRFGNAEMHIFEDKLEVLQEKACKSKNPTLLKSCLTRSRRNIREEHTQKGSQCMAEGRPKRVETIEFELTSEKGCRLISAPDIQGTAISNHPWIDMPTREDSSSLDSDDSIEQEIQRFLAEKAKDSPSTQLDSAGALESFATVKAAQQQTGQPKGKLQQVEGGDTALAKRSKRTKKGCQPVGELRSPLRTEREGAENISQIGKQTVTCVDFHSQAIAKLKGNQGLLQARGAGLSVKGMGVDRKGISDGKLVQRSLPSWKEKPESGKLQNYFKPVTLFRRKNLHELKISSKLTAGFQSAQKKEKSVLLRKNQSIELSVPQSRVFRRHEALLGERCKGTVWKRILGSKSKADWNQRCMAEELYPSATGKMEVAPLSRGVVSLATAEPVGDEESCSHAGSEQSSLPKESRVDDANVNSVPSEIPVKEKEGKIQGHSNSWEELSTPESCNAPLKDKSIVDPPR